MGSLTKDARGRSKFWYACYKSGTRRLKKSTGTKDRQEAKKILEALERGEELAAAGKLTENRLRTLLHDTMERVTGQKSYDPSIQDWLQTWLTNKETKLSKSSLSKCRQAVALFLKFLGPRSLHRLETITTQDIFKFQEQLRSEGRAPATVNLLVNRIISMPFTLARKQGLISLHPCELVEALPDRAKPEKGVFTPEQVEALMQAADIDWRGLILTAYFSGARLGDLSRLTWGNVDVTKRTIVFVQAKTGARVLIPIHTQLLDHLTALPSADTESTPVFPSLHGKPVEGRHGLSTTFKEIMSRAGVASGVGRTGNSGVGRSTSNLSFHSFRHTFTSKLANASVPGDVRQLLTGHADPKSHKVYSHHEMATIRQAIDQIPRI